jgi:hypothetical protein
MEWLSPYELELKQRVDLALTFSVSMDESSTSTVLSFVTKLCLKFSYVEMFPDIISCCQDLAISIKRSALLKPMGKANILTSILELINVVLLQKFECIVPVWESNIVQICLDYFSEDFGFILPGVLFRFFDIVITSSLKNEVFRHVADLVFTEVHPEEIIRITQSSSLNICVQGLLLLNRILKMLFWQSVLEDGRENGIFSLFFKAVEIFKEGPFSAKPAALRFILAVIDSATCEVLMDDVLPGFLEFLDFVLEIPCEMAFMQDTLITFSGAIMKLQSVDGGNVLTEMMGNCQIKEKLCELADDEILGTNIRTILGLLT